MTTQSTERKYTPWWAFALVVVAGLTAVGLFVSSASQSPITSGRSSSEVVSRDTVAHDGKLEFSVQKVQRRVAEIGDPYFGTSPRAGSYTVVTLSVRNTSNESVTFDGSYIVGLDSSGGQVYSDREAQYYANDDGAGMLTSIAPGGQIRTSVAFDVPSDAKLTGVEVHDSVFSRGATISFKASS